MPDPRRPSDLLTGAHATSLLPASTCRTTADSRAQDSSAARSERGVSGWTASAPSRAAMSDALALELLNVTRAKRWRAYVLNPKTWSDEIWDEACARGLAVRRASRDQSAH